MTPAPTPALQKWAFATGGTVYSSPTIGADGTIYFGSNDGNVYAVNPNGSQKWSFTTLGDVSTSPALGVDGTIYVASQDRNLYALNPGGRRTGNSQPADALSSSPAIGSDGTIYVGSYDDNLYARKSQRHAEMGVRNRQPDKLLAGDRIRRHASTLVRSTKTFTP